MNIAVAVTTYRRPYYTRILAEQLQDCPYPIYVSQDYNPAFHAACAEVQELLPPTYFNERRKGIDENKLFLLDKVFIQHGHDAVIFIEDDTIPYDLHWFETQLLVHAADPKFLAACGYNRQVPASVEQWIEEYSGRLEETWQSTFNPWGWAMRRDTYLSLYANNGAQYRADVGSEVNGRFDWWLSARENMYCVRPVVARVQSIGWKEAEHTPNRDYHYREEYNPVGIWTLQGKTPTYD